MPVAAGDIQEAWERVIHLSYVNLRYEKTNLTIERNTDKHSLEAVGILKRGTDMEVKYLIYKINNSLFNEDPDNMFKSNHLIGELKDI